MFDRLTDKLAAAFKKLKGHGKLTEAQVGEGLREVRLALLEADVNYKDTKTFIDRVKERAVGEEVLRSLTPAQQVVKIVHEELTTLLGGESPKLDLGGRPPIALMLVGLQGSGKTTTAAKLARRLKSKGGAFTNWTPAATSSRCVASTSATWKVSPHDGCRARSGSFTRNTVRPASSCSATVWRCGTSNSTLKPKCVVYQSRDRTWSVT